MHTQVFIPRHLIGIALLACLLFLALFTHVPRASAQDDLPAQVAALEAQVAALTERVAQLEAELVQQSESYQSNNASIAYVDYSPNPTANSNANLYSGPSTKYRVAGYVGQGQRVDIVGCNATCNWYALNGGYWIAAHLVNNPPVDLRRINAPDQPTQNSSPTTIPPTATPVVAYNPTPLPTPSATPLPAEPTPTFTPSPTPTFTPAPTFTPTPTFTPAGTAQVIIADIYYDGEVRYSESDEYAIISNVGSTPVNITGWRLYADDNGQDFFFPNYELAAGQSVRVYTNEEHPETGGFSFGSGTAIWNNTEPDCGFLYDSSGSLVSEYCY